MAGKNSSLKVMSYNIKYATEEDGENSWSKRKDLLSGLLLSYEPDIFGVQEARQEQLQFLKEKLKNYEYFGVGRNGGERGLFNAIFYQKNRFETLEENTFWLSNTPEKPSTGWDAAFPRVCTYALFINKLSEEKFWIFNTHFDHQGEQAVRNSAELIMDRIGTVSEEKHPVILLGDFNLEPNDQPIRYLAKELNDSRKIAKEVAPGPEETFNAYEFHEPPIGRFDYIFVSERIEVIKYEVLTDSNDGRYPSDHFPVLVELLLK